MPSTITPVSAWTTLETPASADVANAASVENAVQRLSNRVEYLKDKALQGDSAWPNAGVGFKLDMSAARADDVPASWGYTGGVSTKQWVSDGSTSGAKLIVPLTGFLRSGEILTGFLAAVKPANARAGAARMSVGLYYIAHDTAVAANNPVAPTLIGEELDDASNGYQFIPKIGLSHTVDRTVNEYFAVVKAGGSTVGIDRVYFIQIGLTDPGPRNI